MASMVTMVKYGRYRYTNNKTRSKSIKAKSKAMPLTKGRVGETADRAPVSIINVCDIRGQI
jgi:hypothetical protein